MIRLLGLGPILNSIAVGAEGSRLHGHVNVPVEQRERRAAQALAVLQMVANGLGWTIMPPLAVCRALDRGVALRAVPYPELSMRRTINVVFRRGEATHLAQQIHDVASQALREYFLPLLTNVGVIQFLKHDEAVADSDVTPEYCATHKWLSGAPKMRCMSSYRI